MFKQPDMATGRRNLWHQLRALRLGDFGVALAVAIAYFLLAKLGLQLASLNPSASPVWPPTGFALAMVLLLGNRVWPGVLAGAVIANATTAGSLATSLAIAIGNTLEAVVGGWCVERWCGGTRAFDSSTKVAKFALISIGPPTVLSATIGVSSLWLGGFIGAGHFSSVWTTWWMGDSTSALLLTPVIVLWADQGRWPPAPQRRARSSASPGGDLRHRLDNLQSAPDDDLGQSPNELPGHGSLAVGGVAPGAARHSDRGPSARRLRRLGRGGRQRVLVV